MAEEQEKRIAVLIDADNAPAAKIDEVLAEVARHGVANVRRAYGNWKSSNLRPWEDVLHEYAIRPMQQFAYSKGKNASDMAMVVDAMDLLYSGRLDGFALVSSDADFTPLVMRLLNDGVKVYGFGERKTPMPFVNACSQFTYVEALGDAEGAVTVDEAATKPAAAGAVGPGDVLAPPPAPTPGPALRSDTRLVNLLRGAVEAVADDHGWAALGAVGKQIANRDSLDPRNHGYRKLSDLITASGLFEVRRQELAVYVRDRRHPEARGVRQAQ
jgi:uncharacterized protein (TIGR00288 family)